MLTGKVAIVTGSGSGMGEATAKQLAKQGVAVAIADLNWEKAVKVADSIKAAGGTAYPVKVNVSDSSSVNQMVNAVVKELGGVDILVNNAGIVTQSSVLEQTDEEWRRILSVDLDGVFYCTRAVAKQMKEQERGGKIVNIASVVANRPRRFHGAYTAAKAAVAALTRVWALDLVEYGINVNAVSPGHIRTPLTEGYFTGKVKEAFEEMIPQGTIGEPDWIASVVVFLCTEAASYVTGQVIDVDGGFNMSGEIPALYRL
ncbi:MAG: SDR family oxidoreductase [Firmicutes bacterium]|jgi:NAD(P)-dependent dehydrogenase (short-subunit alcohol dehydrogenase family)|nr:SDR family oxidoreductase [Bacillota bacterium]